MTEPAFAPWGPGGYVQAPTPEPPEAGLTSVANVETTLQVPSSSADRWELGYTYVPQRASKARNRSQLTQAYGDNLAGDQGPSQVHTIPWLIVVEHSISAVNHAIEDWPAYVSQVLELYTGKALERELWTGEIAKQDSTPNRYLASEDATVVGSGPYDSVKRAVAALVRAASNEGALNIAVHLSRDAAVMAPAEWMSTDTSSTLGFQIVPGAGYAGTGPDGEEPDDGTTWLYATELPNVKLSGAIGIPDDISEAIDKRSNTITFYAERFGAVDFAGPVFACQVTL